MIKKRPASLLLLMLWVTLPTFADTVTSERLNLPIAPRLFTNTVEPTESASTAGHYVLPPKAPAGAPNVLLIMTDDAGFAASSAFGGAVATPTLERLANEGLRYTQFHTTGVCSPTRAALLTGRNHHAVSSGSLVELDSPYEGYATSIPPSAATIARVLRDNGYATAMFGKDHNIHHAERTAVGPFDSWPTGRLRGFDYFYGFISGDTNQWRPSLYENTRRIDARGRDNTLLVDEELADKAIHWLHQKQATAPQRPFFMYYAYGSPHAPHQAPQAWIDRFKGQFDQGWDKFRAQLFEQQKAAGVIPADAELTPRPDMITAWNALPAKTQRVYARYMEVFAAQLAFQDAQTGRLIDELERLGLRDNTVIIFIEGDNGASAESGAPGTLNEMALLSTGREHEVSIDWLAENLDVLGSDKTYQSYPLGWTWAMNTPFSWFKQTASHLGGVRNGMVISWPDGIRDFGAIRQQYHHVIDVMPTVLDITGIPAPDTVDGFEQQPLNGVSMAYSFKSADSPSQRTTQYYELYGNRAIYHEGWLASTSPRFFPWEMITTRENSDTESYNWELYHLANDFTQSHDVAQEYPEKLAELKAIFDNEARANKVYPIQDSGAHTRGAVKARSLRNTRMQTVLWGPNISVDMANAPPMFHLPFILEADIDVDTTANGVIFAAGSAFGGWSFYLVDGLPVVTASLSPLPGGATRLAASRPLSAGNHSLRYEFTPSGTGGTLTLSVDGTTVISGAIKDRPMMMAGNGESLDSGRDTNDPVTFEYQNEGYFTGSINKITLRTLPPARH